MKEKDFDHTWRDSRRSYGIESGNARAATPRWKDTKSTSVLCLKSRWQPEHGRIVCPRVISSCSIDSGCSISRCSLCSIDAGSRAQLLVSTVCWMMTLFNTFSLTVSIGVVREGYVVLLDCDAYFILHGNNIADIKNLLKFVRLTRNLKWGMSIQCSITGSAAMFSRG